MNPTDVLNATPLLPHSCGQPTKNKCLSTGTRHVTPLASQKSEAGVDHEGVKEKEPNVSQAHKRLSGNQMSVRQPNV